MRGAWTRARCSSACSRRSGRPDRGRSRVRRVKRGARPGADTSQVFSKEVSAQVRRIELRTRGLVEALFSGEYHSVFKGRGLEFSDVREYQPGDDVRAIDWNVTAR